MTSHLEIAKTQTAKLMLSSYRVSHGLITYDLCVTHLIPKNKICSHNQQISRSIIDTGRAKSIQRGKVIPKS